MNHWIFFSFIALISTALTTLFIRKLHLDGVPFRLQTSMQFVFPFLGFLIWLIADPELFKINLSYLPFIFVFAVLFTQIGTLLAVKSITLAKNPGYAMAIVRFNLLITTLVAVFIFGSYLDLVTFLAIILISLFSFFIIDFSKKGIKNNGLAWFWYALASAFLTSGYALGSQYFINENIPLSTRMFYAFLIMSVVSIVDLCFSRTALWVNRRDLVLLLGVGVTTLIFNIFVQLAFEYVSNPGFVNAVISVSIIPITFLSAYYFKDELSRRKIIGVLGVLLGLILLSIY